MELDLHITDYSDFPGIDAFLKHRLLILGKPRW